MERVVSLTRSGVVYSSSSCDVTDPPFVAAFSRTAISNRRTEPRTARDLAGKRVQAYSLMPRTAARSWETSENREHSNSKNRIAAISRRCLPSRFAGCERSMLFSSSSSSFRVRHLGGN